MPRMAPWIRKAHYMTVLWLPFSTHVGLKLRLGTSQQSPDQQASTLAPDTSVQIMEFLPSACGLIFLICSWVSRGWNGMTVSSRGIVTRMPSNWVKCLAWSPALQVFFLSSSRFKTTDFASTLLSELPVWFSSSKKIYWSIVNLQCCFSFR